jgi:hypothetical protein
MHDFIIGASFVLMVLSPVFATTFYHDIDEVA